MRPVAIGFGLVVLLAANYYLRATLEDSPRYLYSFLERFYPSAVPILFGELPAWRLFLPLKEVTGAWAATTLILTYLVERVVAPHGAWYLFNALSILVAFGTSFALFRSAVFSFTFAICIGFGTQFYHAYAVTGGIASYLVVSYNMLLMFTTTQVARGLQPKWAWWLAFAFSVALNILAYEGWLDVLVVVWVATPFLYIGLRRMDRLAEAARLIQVAAVLTVAGVAYIYVKVTFGFGQVAGSESDVLFNYDSLWLMADDLIANVFTHTYLAVSNFLPPMLVGSSSLYLLGPDRLVAAQHGYHEAFLYLVPMHHVFFWRFYAGAAFVLVLGALYQGVLRAWRRPSAWNLALIVFLLMLLLPGSTHTMIKFRPMNSMPVMTYHVTVGIIGASLLISWLLVSAQRRWSPRVATVLVVAVWATILYGALARPVYLAHMAAQAGLGNLLYPNPMKALVEKLGGTYTAPAGLPLYQLMPYRHDDEVAKARMMLADLPNPLPPLDQWLLTAATSAPAPSRLGGIDVVGDQTQYGYQMMSPPIPLQAGATYLFRVKFEAETGRVCAGILSGDQQRWVVPPDGATVEFSLPAVTVPDVRVVIANCYIVDSGNPNSKFRLAGGSFALLADRSATP